MQYVLTFLYPLVMNLLIFPAVQEEQEAARLQAEADARRAERVKKSQRRQEKNTGIDTRDDGELEQCPDISVCF